MIDVVYTLARDEAGNLVAALLPAAAAASLAAADRLRAGGGQCQPRRSSSRSPRTSCPPSWSLGVMPHTEWLARDAGGLRANGSLALGVAGRCCPARSASSARLRRAEALELGQLTAAGARLDAADSASLPAARAAAAELAFRAAGALVVAAGSRSSWLISTRSGWPGRRCSCWCSAHGRRLRSASHMLADSRRRGLPGARIGQNRCRAGTARSGSARRRPARARHRPRDRPRRRSRVLGAEDLRPAAVPPCTARGSAARRGAASSST